MLIIAIPKSASTSLMKTLSDNYNLPGNQEYFASANAPQDEFVTLRKYHSDMKEITVEHVDKWTCPNIFFKQHVLPTNNNQDLLKNHKKVILLRDPIDIVLSYRRTQLTGLSNERIEFRGCKTEEEWIRQAGNNGLLEDLRQFYTKWLEHVGEKLIVHYTDFINNPDKEMNRIAGYWDLPLVHKPVTVAKERYTRVNILDKMRNRIRRIIKHYRKKFE